MVIVVYDDFMALPVALTWCKDNGPGIFKHGDEVRYDDGLREEIFVGAEERRALPLP